MNLWFSALLELQRATTQAAVRSHRLFHQASLSARFSRQACWSGLPLPPPGDLPDSGIEPTSFVSSALAGGVFTTAPPEKQAAENTKPQMLLPGEWESCRGIASGYTVIINSWSCTCCCITVYLFSDKTECKEWSSDPVLVPTSPWPLSLLWVGLFPNLGPRTALLLNLDLPSTLHDGGGGRIQWQNDDFHHWQRVQKDHLTVGKWNQLNKKPNPLHS